MPEYRLPIRVYIEDTDAGGIVYYVNYLKYFERARTELIRSLGVDKTAVMEDGSVFVVLSAVIDYHAPALLDDQLEAVAEVVSSGAATIEFRQSVLRSGVELAGGQVRVALTDGKSGKPKRMPKGLRELLAQSIGVIQEW